MKQLQWVQQNSGKSPPPAFIKRYNVLSVHVLSVYVMMATMHVTPVKGDPLYKESISLYK